MTLIRANFSTSLHPMPVHNHLGIVSEAWQNIFKYVLIRLLFIYSIYCTQVMQSNAMNTVSYIYTKQ